MAKQTTPKVTEEKALAPAVESKDVAIAAPTAVAAVNAAPDSAWGSEDVDNSDIIISKILVMQGMSDLVSDRKALIGELRDTLNGKLLGGMVGDKCKPMPFIAFHTFKTWIINHKETPPGAKEPKWVFKQQIPMTADNKGWEWNETVDGVEVRRDKVLNFYVLLPEEIAAGEAFPYLLSFRRTSYKAGQRISTEGSKLRALNKPLAQRVFNLGVVEEEGDEGKYCCLSVELGPQASDAEKAKAYEWYKVMQKATVRIDDSDLAREAAASPRVVDEAPDGEGIKY